ncbi:MAG: leucine-rich repeat protein, partial [Prevotella sp.]|nr:leucine-rich repeat protein [Prevotella sp.]
MKKKQLIMSVLAFVSAIVAAGVHGLPLMNGQDVQKANDLTSINQNDSTVTIYVLSSVAPYLFVWAQDEEGGYPSLNGDWPGTQMTEQTVVNGVSFWYHTISSDYTPNIIFNNGQGYQTEDINEITSDRYFYYNGASLYVDITDKVVNGDIIEKEDWVSTNHDASSYSMNIWLLDNTETSMLRFSWSVSSEGGYDMLRITLDDVTIVEASGEQSGLYENYIDGGQHLMIATYSKDGSGNSGSDQATVSDINFRTIDEIIAEKIVHVQEVAAANNNINNALLAEANNYIAKINAGQYDKSKGSEVIAKLDEYATRLAYLHLDIAVPVQGAMGDSILSKVENFVDVQSIKISGTLNDADLSTIQSRLSQLREIDMTDINLTTLPNRLFYQRSLLEVVKLPSALTSIGEYAFYQCYGLKHINFPTSLTAIYRYAFSECDNLQEVILPEGLTTMGEGTFYSCDNNKYVKLPSSLATISSDAFYYNVSLKDIDFAEGLTHIEYNAFSDCYALNNLIFPSTLYYIGNNAFAYNRALSDIEFNEGLFQIADNAFDDCDALTEVTLPSSLVLANESPFDYCDNLKKVTCLSIEPPYMTDQIPYGLSMDGRELYVPALSINTYKQTTGWDKFPTILPIDYLPENITVLGNLKLTLPETIPADYKPNVSIIYNSKGGWYNEYGSLTVNGDGVLSISDFSMLWDPAYEYDYYDRNQNYCSLLNNSHLRSDNVNIDIDTRNNIWTFITLPFDVKVSEIETTASGTTNWIIRKYDGQKRAQGETSDTWIKMTDSDILQAGEGYIIQGSRYIGNDWQSWSRFHFNAINNANKNNIFRAADVTVTLNEYESEFAHNRSWNFIGNPYPCYYDTRFMDFEAPITVWNMRNNTYEAYSPADDSYILCPGEAFFVQRPIDNGNIVFSKEGRQTNRDVRAMEAPAHANAHRAGAANATRTIVNLSLSDGNNTD